MYDKCYKKTKKKKYNGIISTYYALFTINIRKIIRY